VIVSVTFYDLGMPDALDIPGDLVVLQRTRLAAQAEVEAFAAAVDERVLAEGPDPEERSVSLRWTVEDDAELSRLRVVRDEAVLAVRAHPVIQRAFEERCWLATWQALQDAARAQ